MPLWICFCWFMSGAIVFHLLEKLINTGTLIRIVNQSIESSLRIMRISSRSYEITMQIKYNLLEEAGTSETQIEFMKNIDTNMLTMWQTEAIAGIINQIPAKLKPAIKFRTWQAAMDILKEQENGKRKNRR